MINYEIIMVGDKMAVGGDNCDKCPEILTGKCDGKASDCICKRCPRNLGQCLTTKYCRETESIINI
jgi:hypothetical protein